MKRTPDSSTNLKRRSKSCCLYTYPELNYHVSVNPAHQILAQLVHDSVPTLFLILGWGYQPERVQAGIYLLFYTLLASLPLLVGILFVYDSLGSLCLFMLCGSSSLVGGLFYVCMIFAFLVRMPIFIVHLWLPRAHVEAPVSGSIILAGDNDADTLKTLSSKECQRYFVRDRHVISVFRFSHFLLLILW